MYFRLTYEGPLPAHPGREVATVKHAIRRQLHPQLADLCKRTPGFASLTKKIRDSEEPPEYQGSLPALHAALHPDFSALRAKLFVGGFEFVPLIIDKMMMVCELDILFLRREKPGSLITKPKDEYGGDLDNRLKVFFDALRLPCAVNELPSGEAPSPDEIPFYCLLEDDSLITKFQVESDTLLGGPLAGPKDVRLVVKVTVRVTQNLAENTAFV